MTVRRLILFVGAALLIAGIVALLVPVSVQSSSGQGTGQSIGCGNAVVADLSAAQAADQNNPVNLPIVNQLVPHTTYVAQCQSSLSQRRTWSIPLAVIGALAIAGAFLVRGAPSRSRAV
jgi:hypothetical protein